MSTGWTWDQVETGMTVPRFQALSRYWQRHPPLHVMAAAWLGIKPKLTAERGDLGDLVAMFADGRIR